MSATATSRQAPSAQDTPGGDHVRESTPSHVVAELDRDLEARVAAYRAAPPQAVDDRIAELEREWDIERTLTLNASTLALSGLVLSRVHRRAWLWLPASVLTFLAQHAIQGWCPPIEVFRRLGVRTRTEIEAERHALKALRGDYDHLVADGAAPH
jgi:hypothetical protein